MAGRRIPKRQCTVGPGKLPRFLFDIPNVATQYHIFQNRPQKTLGNYLGFYIGSVWCLLWVSFRVSRERYSPSLRRSTMLFGGLRATDLIMKLFLCSLWNFAGCRKLM